MTKIADLWGTSTILFQIGVSTGSGTRVLRFRNSFNADLEWTPTANQTITLPDASGTVALVANRIVGVIQIYTGTIDPQIYSQGYYDDFDGKWVLLTLNSIRTIGNASSGANIAAIWARSLFEHFWNVYSNTQCPVLDSSGNAVSRGGSGSDDFDANRRITIPDYRGRVFAGAGTGTGLTARTKGATVGAETHTLSPAEMPSHTHTIDNVSSFNSGGSQYGGSATQMSPTSTTNSAGGGQAHNNMQPTAIEHLVISAGAR